MKNILITGISKGLGLEIATNLLENGNAVYGVNRTISPELQTLLEKCPEQLFLYQFDLEKSEEISATLFTEFLKFDVQIHGYVNNAAFAYDDIVTNLNLSPLEKMYRINVFSPMLITKYVIRNMLLHHTKGSIVHLSSISVHTGYKGLAMYASTKGALEAFSKNTAREWGVRGIRSNCIVAGFMETNMSASLTNEQKNRIFNRTALKQPTELNSVARTISFLLSDDSSSITGQNVFVDSGTI
jgi:3-oxoacyl-[acyl-carrier protein] reductase